MTLYTTPLQFGYFFSLLLWILFLVRGYQEQRLSDKLLGWIMFILAMELQDYTFGFAGINILWNELNGFPRGVSLLFGPLIYFYFRSQVNRSFSFRSKDLWHLTPYMIYFLYQMFFFLQGSEAVQKQQASTSDLVLNYISVIVLWVSYIFYFKKCLYLYREYRKWSIHQFSNAVLIDFKWFRNFLYAMMWWLVCKEFVKILDALVDLNFYQDWWWNLPLVVVSIYIGLAGFTQKQPAKIAFTTMPERNMLSLVERAEILDEKQESIEAASSGISKAMITNQLTELMRKDKLYLQPDLNLYELALHLQVNTSQLSSTINQELGQNFNDYINTLRIEEFIRLFQDKKNQHFTMLSLALDSGFNSKATFNRAFKKLKKKSPKEYLRYS